MVLTIITIYLALGIFLNLINPVKEVINKEVFRLQLENISRIAQNLKPVTEYKILLFKIILFLGVILFWPFFLPGIFKEYYNNKCAIDEDSENVLGDNDEKEVDRKFGMSGLGDLACCDCNFSITYTSFTHGYVQNESGAMFRTSTSGFQCQSCGEFTKRSQTEPFSESHFTHTLEDIPDEQRAHRIEIMKSMKEMCESSMQDNPDSKLFKQWESQVSNYAKELNTVSLEELKAIKEKREEFNKAYAASLFCDCGEKLGGEQALFCPLCKSENLKYNMKVIT